MATPQRAEHGYHGRGHVSMGELLASGAAAHAVSTPPRRTEPTTVATEGESAPAPASGRTDGPASLGCVGRAAA